MKRYLYVEEPEGEFCQLNITLDEFYHTSHKIDNQQKEIERLNSNCKTLAKMLDKEIEKNSKAIEYINHRKETCERQEDVIGMNILISIEEILKEEYNVGKVK